MDYNGVIVDGSEIDVFRDSIADTPTADFVASEQAEAQIFDVPAILLTGKHEITYTFSRYRAHASKATRVPVASILLFSRHSSTVRVIQLLVKRGDFAR